MQGEHKQAGGWTTYGDQARSTGRIIDALNAEYELVGGSPVGELWRSWAESLYPSYERGAIALGVRVVEAPKFLRRSLPPGVQRVKHPSA